jgi:hypothetical protein
MALWKSLNAPDLLPRIEKLFCPLVCKLQLSLSPAMGFACQAPCRDRFLLHFVGDFKTLIVQQDGVNVLLNSNWRPRCWFLIPGHVSPFRDLPVFAEHWKAGTGRRPALSLPMINQQLSGTAKL